MKPGTYDRTSLAAEIASTSYRFGDWEFRPVVCEVWDVPRQTVVLLTYAQSELLERLIAAFPAYVSKLQDQKGVIYHLRRKLGAGVIVSDRRGYRFRPEAVL